MQDFERIRLISSKMKIEGPSMAFTANIMRSIENEEIKWSFNYVLKNVFPFIFVGTIFITIFILNLFGIHLIDIYSILNIPQWVKDYNFYMKIISLGLSTTISLMYIIKQSKIKLINI